VRLANKVLIDGNEGSRHWNRSFRVERLGEEVRTRNSDFEYNLMNRFRYKWSSVKTRKIMYQPPVNGGKH
jgi:hypothetical protein